MARSLGLSRDQLAVVCHGNAEAIRQFEKLFALVDSLSTGTGGAPSGPAGGALAGDYPDPTIAVGAVGPTELAPTSVTAGSYTITSLTVDADGRITAASNGAAAGGTFGQATATFTTGDAVTVTVADAGVSAGSNIVPTIAMGTRDADEMEMAPVVVAVGTVTAGVGFDLIVVSLDGDADGDYLVNYTRD